MNWTRYNNTIVTSSHTFGTVNLQQGMAHVYSEPSFQYQNAANAGESGMTAKVAYRRLRNHLPVLSFECHHSEACRQKRACRSIPPPGLIMSTIVRNMRAMPTKDPSGNVGRGMPEYDRSLLLFITIARSRMPAKAAGCQSRWAYLVSVPHIKACRQKRQCAVVCETSGLNHNCHQFHRAYRRCQAMDLHVVKDIWPVFGTTSYSIMPTRDHI